MGNKTFAILVPTIGIVLFILFFSLSSCKSYSTEDVVFYLDSTSVEFKKDSHYVENLDTIIYFLNVLASKLELDFRFQNNIIVQLSEEELNSPNFNLLKGRESSIHIYLSNKIGLNPYTTSLATNNYSYIPFKFRYRPSVYLHEIFHKFHGKDFHSPIDSSTAPPCQVPKENPCLNLMTQFYRTPLAILLYEEEHMILNKEDRRNYISPCNKVHVYPKDLVNKGIETKVSCCNEFIEPTKTFLTMNVSVKYDEPELYDAFIQFLKEVFFDHGICLRQRSLGEAKFVQDSISPYIIEVPTEMNVVKYDGFGNVTIDSVFSSQKTKIEVNRNTFAEISQARKILFLTDSENMNLMKEEALYLSEGDENKANYLFRLNYLALFHSLLKEQNEIFDKKRGIYNFLPIHKALKDNYSHIPEVKIALDNNYTRSIINSWTVWDTIALF